MMTTSPRKPTATCGIYASKSHEHLRSAGYERYGIYGEVHLWGTVVEHELGWRAQYAYPKSLVLPLEMIPLGVETLESSLQSLVDYGCDLFLFGEDGNVPLWVRGSGYNAAGIDMLIQRCAGWYAQRARERQINRGDRVAVLDRGIAVVEQVDGKWIRAVLWNKSSLKIARVCVRWDDQNVRWEQARTHVPRPTQKPDRTHCSFAYSAVAYFRMGVEKRTTLFTLLRI